MLYYDFYAGDTAYKLRLNTRNVVALEKSIGCNPLSIFGAGDTLPPVTTMAAILHNSLQQYQHNITLNDAYDIFDNYLADGNTTTDFIKVIIEVYKVSGLIPKEAETEKN